MKLTDRQANLLFATVGEYIRTGEPVASDELRARYKLPYSPATIRNEFLTLSDFGLLTQPHTSAGRMPSDEGYRWYAANARGHGGLERDETRLLLSLAPHLRDADRFFQAAAEMFAQIAEALVVAGSIRETEPLHKSGFREVFALPEFTDPNIRDSFGELIDSIDQDMRDLARGEDFCEPQVFIGDENPIREAASCGMIIRTVSDGDVSGVIAIIGPKRMRYDKGLSLLMEMDNVLKRK